MLSSIQIVKHTFSKVEINLDPLYDRAIKTEQIEFEISITDPTHDKVRDLWNFSLEFRFHRPAEAKNNRYEGHIKAHGVFRIHPQFDPKLRVSLVRMNGSSLLLGAIREMVILITSRAPRGPLEIAAFEAKTFVESPKTTESASRRKGPPTKKTPKSLDTKNLA